MADWEDAPSLTKDQADKIAKAGSLVTGDQQWEDAPSQYSKFMRDQSVPRRTTLEGVGEGIADPAIAAAQLEAHVLPKPAMEGINWARGLLGRQPITTASVDKAVQDREARIQASRPIEYAARTPQEQAAEEAGSHPVRRPIEPGVDTARLGGNLLATLPMAALGPSAGAGALARIGGSAAVGGLAASLNPVTQGDFWTEKAKQAGIGAATGGAAAEAGTVAAGALAPTFRPAVRLLVDEGVHLTPGQMAGGMAKAIEDKATSLPITGDAIAAAQRRSVQSFNRAAINRPLAEIGTKLPDNVPAGRGAIDHMQTKLSDAYRTLLPKLTYRPDAQLLTDLGGLRPSVATMLPEYQQQFGDILKATIFRRLGPGGTMTGESFKEGENALTQEISAYSRSSLGAEQKLGRLLSDAKDLIKDNLERVNTANGDELRRLNRAYAMAERVGEASAKRTVQSSPGVFTPADLLGSVRSAAARTGQKHAYRAGDSMMQDLADAAQDVIGNRYPDSGTAGRLLMSGGIGGLALGGHPGALLGLAAGAVPYTSPGINLLRSYAAAVPGPVRNMLARGLRQAPPALAAPSGVATNALLSPMFAPQAPQQ